MTPITLSGHTIDFSDGVMERDARLLVAGSYPDKGLTVTEADIDALVTNFSAPVPVKVEHIDSPLDPLGLVTRVWRAGSELLGRVTFPAEMAQFLVRRDAHKLSVGLQKEPAWRLLEASLTRHPHVPTATLLSEGRASRALAGETSPRSQATDPLLPKGEGEEGVELARLRSQVRKQTVDAQIVALKAAGKVIPATEALARALLSAEDSACVTLSRGGPAQSVAGVALALLKAQPPLVRLGELAGGAKVQLSVIPALAAGAGMLDDDDEPEFTEADREMMRRMGVKPDDVRATMRADRMADKNSAKGKKRER